MTVSGKACRLAAASTGALTTLGLGQALADGIPEPGQIGFDEAVTPIAHQMHFFHNVILLPIVIAISLFVAVLLGICIVKFNEKANPVPSKTTHHTGLEIA